MNRRQFLGTSGLCVTALLAGCGGGGSGVEGTPPRPSEDGDGTGDGNVDLGTLGPAGADLEVTAFDYGPGENGNLTVSVGARNTADEPVTVVLVQSVTVEGSRLERRRPLEFAAGGSKNVTVTFDVTMSAFQNASSSGINGPEWAWPDDADGS